MLVNSRLGELEGAIVAHAIFVSPETMVDRRLRHVLAEEGTMVAQVLPINVKEDKISSVGSALEALLDGDEVLGVGLDFHVGLSVFGMPHERRLGFRFDKLDFVGSELNHGYFGHKGKD